MKLRLLVPVLAVLIGFVAAAWGGGTDGPTMVYRLADNDGVAATADDVKAALRVLERRFKSAEIAGVSVTPTADGRIVVTLADSLAPQAESIWKLAERPGTLELRIQADATTERKHRELRDASGGAADAPAEFRWVPRGAGDPDMLVRTPEAPLLAALRKLEKAGVKSDTAEYLAAKKRYDDAVRDEVFTGDQIDRANVQHQNTKEVVYFSFKEERKPYFAAFTERHVKQNVAIILDGRVHSAPVINSKLPGEGIIEGGGAGGFTEAEATELAAVLGSGALPGRLVRVPPPEKK